MRQSGAVKFATSFARFNANFAHTCKGVDSIRPRPTKWQARESRQIHFPCVSLSVFLCDNEFSLLAASCVTDWPRVSACDYRAGLSLLGRTVCVAECDSQFCSLFLGLLMEAKF